MIMNIRKLLCFLSVLPLLWACQPEEGPIIDPIEKDSPANVTLVSSTSSSLTFSWDKVPGAESYSARLENDDRSFHSQQNPEDTSVTFSNLVNGNTYVFMVKAKIRGGYTLYSDPLFVVVGDNSSETPDNPVDPVPSEHYAEFLIPAHEDAHGKALAFPGAEGGGMYTTGGRGGKVIHVTNLNDSGAGSLRAALAESGPRTIVFDVAGLISLNSALKISKGDVTIAGQTAPGDGICLRHFTTNVDADNVIIRFVRFRMGDEKKSEDDAFGGRYHQNIILDHCSMSWSTDECSSFYANKNFTMQWCILTESLRNSVHGKGNHGYGGIWGGKNASFHHNLLSAHDSRNPRIDHPQLYGDYVATHRGNVDYRCNAVYNWGDNSTYGGEDGRFNIINNYYKPGPASKNVTYLVDAYGYYYKDDKYYADKYAQMYLSGNVNTSRPELSANDVSTIYWHNGTSWGNYGTVLSNPLKLYGPSSENIYTTTHSAEDSFLRICESAGASLARDAVDLRACNDAKTGTATCKDGGNGSTNGIIDTQSAVGGWPAYEASADEITRVKDTDGDGMPDWFEDRFGLKRDNPSDGNDKTLDSYGRYTNLEMYLHYLVKDIVKGQTQGGTYDKIS